jgi:quinol-cytochrome oxidoreductase complex cytochrome b subunit
VRGKPIHYLANVSRWIWLLIGGAAVVFFAIVALLTALHPYTPANQLVSSTNGWMFLLPAAMAALGVYMSLRWWRCPQCARPLGTRRAVPEHCPRCGMKLRDF